MRTDTAEPATGTDDPGTTDLGTDETDLEQRCVEAAVELARTLLASSLAEATLGERRRQSRLGRMLADLGARELTFCMTDEVLRVTDRAVAARRFRSIVAAHPTTALGRLDAVMLRVGAALAPLLPRWVMPLVIRRVRAETRGIVLPPSDPQFAQRVAHRASAGVRLNVNPLGEAILSDAEAAERIRLVHERIERADVDYVSVKISSLVANLDALAFDHSVDRVCERLTQLYRRAEASTPRTFVNLDMEEYRDLELTMQAFTRVLSLPKFVSIDAGIVLQAYLPDSHGALERLGQWATARRVAGGGRVKVRLLKGANLAMEQVEAELHGWVAAPHATKADVDASYKAMLDSALRPEWADAIRIGVASHNLFDIAWALVVGAEAAALERLEIEMLEGMAPAQARAVLAVAGGLLRYAPVVADEDIDASIAYLSRRLDENTHADNFLRALFDLTPVSMEFEEQERRFRESVTARRTVPTTRRRVARERRSEDRFANEPDSDATDDAVRATMLTALSAPPAVEVRRITAWRASTASLPRHGGATANGTAT